MIFFIPIALIDFFRFTTLSIIRNGYRCGIMRLIIERSAAGSEVFSIVSINPNFI